MRLTGNVIADIEYRLVQTDDNSRLEDHGVIDYNLSLASGTGISQVNDVWYATRTFTDTDSLNLASLSIGRLGQTHTTSFLGVGSEGNIKGFKLDNNSGETLYLNLPFRNFSGSLEVGPSGSIMYANAEGWSIPSSNTLVNISGETTGNSKNYSIGFLGVASPLLLNIDGLINYDYFSSGFGSGVSGTLLIEYLASSVNTGTMEYEWNASITGIENILQIDYLSSIFFGATGTGTGTGTTMPLDFFSIFSGAENNLNIEWTGFPHISGSGGSGFSELIQNPSFDIAYVDCELLSRPSDGFGCIGYPHWYVSGEYITYFADQPFREFILGYSSYFGHWSNPWNVKCSHCRKESYIKQTVTVVPGALYKFEFFPKWMENPQPEVGYPTVKLLSGSGTELARVDVTPSWLFANRNTWVAMYATAADTELTVEFRIPADKYPQVPPYIDGMYNGVFLTYNNYFSWGGDATGRKVSLYRVG